ncbi:sliding clamp [Synechococcus phage S-SZBM1]|uniref:Sliding clamp n=1 Tax=Synechococcus phage S-SZBM1 TaxID=2926475 RepID=A0AC61TSP7_9CAUD|nr:sliding clamp [Synechococcus phage S-SZBM1]UNH61277.1 sliding clamp [Synechococcus phage S-SZBM1]
MTCMKFTDYEMEVLQSFRDINPSIMFKPGHRVSTISNNKNILAVANFPSTDFPNQAPIYDLGNLINSIRILGSNTTTSSPDVDFLEKRVDIVSNRSRIKYYYAEPRMVTTPPESIQDLGAPVVSTYLTMEDLRRINTVASTYQLPDVCFSGKDGQLTAIVTDKRNTSSNSMEIELGETDRNFCFCMKVENLSVIRFTGANNPSEGYNLDLFECKVARFSATIAERAQSTVDSLVYLIALEPDSEY